eukprot:1925559-Pleurochrysis_carterae.AAC.1
MGPASDRERIGTRLCVLTPACVRVRACACVDVEGGASNRPDRERAQWVGASSAKRVDAAKKSKQWRRREEAGAGQKSSTWTCRRKGLQRMRRAGVCDFCKG